ncbi:MAG: hypothetical protein AB7U73_14770 [Pirellulales bacterium]
MRRLAQALLLGLLLGCCGCQVEELITSLLGGRNSNEANLKSIDSRNAVLFYPNSTMPPGNKP